MKDKNSEAGFFEDLLLYMRRRWLWLVLPTVVLLVLLLLFVFLLEPASLTPHMYRAE